MPESTNVPPSDSEVRTVSRVTSEDSTNPGPADTAPSGVTPNPAGPLPVVPGYDISEILGRGGMGVIYRATQQSLNRPVALKMILGDAVTPVERARFVLEARSAARLQHAHVVQVFEVGEADGRPFISMEFCPGGTLAERARRAPLSHRDAAALVEKIARGVGAAHAGGLVHRDLKPHNVLFAADGEPKVSDFGLARDLASDDVLTATGAVLGTPAYMAPEQAEGNRAAAGPPTDVYALGVILYELLTGRVPFIGPPLSVLRRLGHEEPPPPSSLTPGLDPGLDAVVRRAMATRSENRYRDANELAAALREWLAGRTTAAAPRDVVTTQMAATPPDRRRARAGAAVIVLASAIALGAVAYFTSPDSAGTVPPEPTTPNPVAPAPAVRPLTGELIVRVWSAEGKRGLRVDESGALPVRNGEQIHLEARLDEAAYIYVLWISSDGQVQPLYPWKPPSPLDRPPALPARSGVHSPERVDRGWEVDGPSGLETAVLLARREPLPSDLDWQSLVGRVAPSRFSHPQEVAWLEVRPGAKVAEQARGLHRGLNVQESRQIDEPILQLLERLRGRFELVKAVRFAHEGN